MPANAGYRLFVAGEKFLASQVNTYLMQQSIMYFATTAARDAAITSPVAGMHVLIDGTYDLWQEYSGAAWITYLARGAGTPEGNVTATVGCIYQRTDGGSGATLYYKDSGSGNTGWVALAQPIDFLWIGAESLTDLGAIALTTDANGAVVLPFEDAVDEFARAAFMVPPTWATVNVIAWWSQASGSGNARLYAAVGSSGDGEAASVGSATESTVAAGTALNVNKDTLLSGQAVTPGEIFHVKVGRDGGDVLDTLTGVNVYLYGVEIRRAS